MAAKVESKKKKLPGYPEPAKMATRMTLDLGDFPEMKGMDLGSKCSMMVTGKVVGIRKDDYENTMTLEVEECTPEESDDSEDPKE